MNTLKLVLAAVAWAATCTTQALEIPGADGSDGPFAPTTNIEVDLGAAETGSWNGVNRSPGKGVYDAEQWAVVYRFSTVNVPANVAVTFKNHSSRAPVVWLVDGDVTIAGSISVSAQSQTDPEQVGEPGPGGFRGGLDHHPGLPDAGDGLGPGGGKEFGGGSYATTVSPGGFGNRGPAALNTYGSARIVPLIGGSGSGGHTGGGGGSGGGAILIAARGTLNLAGSIEANGGCCSIGGSGGAVRLIARKMTGAGRITALGYINFRGEYGVPGDGRIRLETVDAKAGYLTRPEAIFVSPDQPLGIWPDTMDPRASIDSVAGQTMPRDPRAEWRNGIAADLILNSTGDVDVKVRCNNISKSGRVMVRSVPKRGTSRMYVAEYESGDEVESIWKAKLPLGVGYAVLQAYAFTE